MTATGQSDRSIAELMRSTRVISDMMTAIEIEIVLERLERTLEASVPGDVVELGCNCGTTSIFIAKFLERFGGSRTYHVYDSFTGLPASGPQDRRARWRDLPSGTFAVAREEFEHNLEAAGVARMPEIHEGRFEQLGSVDLPDAISWAFLDGDLYSSIVTSLELVYPRLQAGGTMVVDDYGFEALPGVERACADFLADKPESAMVVDGMTLAVISKGSGR